MWGLRAPAQAKHNEFTHFPKSPDCPICQGCTTQREQCRVKVSGKPDDLHKPEKFVDAITMDHAIVNEVDASRCPDRNALITQDRATNWLQGYAAKTKEHSEIQMALSRFLGPQQKAKYVYTDASKELAKSPF